MRFISRQGLIAILLTVTLWGLPAALAAQQDAAPQSGSTQTRQSVGPSLTSIDYSRSHAFPNFFDAYVAPPVPRESMANSELLHSLIQNGKLKLSIEDALALALENNLDIAVARYQIPFSETDLLRAKAGGATRGVSGAFQSSATFAGAIGGGVSGFSGGGTGGAGGVTGGGGAINVGSTGCCDPTAGFSFGWDRRTSPLNFTVVSGVPQVTTQNTSYSTFFAQGFLTGTSYVVAVNGFRQSTTSLNTLFNPEVPVGMTLGFNQHLLNGFGYRANAIFVRQAKNELKIADSTFRQQVITSVGTVLNLYYTLLSDKENVRVAQEAVAYAQKLLSDNKKQVEIGTLAPIEVVRAESEVATDQQNLIVAQTTFREDAEKLKTALSKHVDSELAGAEIDLTDPLPEPKDGDIEPLDQALKTAVANRPEIEQSDLNLRNQEITLQNIHNRLLPSLDLFATYAPTGLSGDTPIFGSCPAGSALVGSTCVFSDGSTVVPPVIGTTSKGVSQSLSQVLHGRYPDYSFGVNLTIPIRNRSAQADAARALLEQHELETQLQRTKNQIEQDVRNAEIAVTQARAQIDAASKARILAQQTLDAERKKFQLGESTVFLVIQAERDLTTAEGNETKAHSTYAQALTAYSQATATILDKYNIRMADARKGAVTHVPNIPGTPPASSSSPN